MVFDALESDKELTPGYIERLGIYCHTECTRGLNAFDVSDPDIGYYTRHSGVYFIGDFYVGQSKNIGHRLACHRADSYKLTSNVGKAIDFFLKNHPMQKIPVLIISYDTKKESECIDELSLRGFNLVNKMPGITQ